MPYLTIKKNANSKKNKKIILANPKKEKNLNKYQQHVKKTLKKGGDVKKAGATWDKKSGKPKANAIYKNPVNPKKKTTAKKNPAKSLSAKQKRWHAHQKKMGSLGKGDKASYYWNSEEGKPKANAPYLKTTAKKKPVKKTTVKRNPVKKTTAKKKRTVKRNPARATSVNVLGSFVWAVGGVGATEALTSVVKMLSKKNDAKTELISKFIIGGLTALASNKIAVKKDNAMALQIGVLLDFTITLYNSIAPRQVAILQAIPFNAEANPITPKPIQAPANNTQGLQGLNTNAPIEKPIREKKANFDQFGRKIEVVNF